MARRVVDLLLILPLALLILCLAACQPVKGNTDPRRGLVVTENDNNGRMDEVCQGPDLWTSFTDDTRSWQYDSRDDPRCKP